MIWTTQDHQLTRGGAVATDPREDEAIRGVNERLKAAYGETHSPDEITAVVAGPMPRSGTGLYVTSFRSSSSAGRGGSWTGLPSDGHGSVRRRR